MIDSWRNIEDEVAAVRALATMGKTRKDLEKKESKKATLASFRVM